MSLSRPRCLRNAILSLSVLAAAAFATDVHAQSTALHTYTGVGWHLVSAPYVTNQSISSIDSNSFAWNPATQSYSIPTTSFQFGQSYWIYLTTPSLDIPGPGTAADITKPVTIPLSPGWNIVGEPFTNAEPLSQITVTNSSGGSTAFSTAASSANLVSPLYTYDLTSQMYNLLNSDGQAFLPWDGAWIYAKQSGLSLVMTFSFSAPPPPPPPF